MVTRFEDGSKKTSGYKKVVRKNDPRFGQKVYVNRGDSSSGKSNCGGPKAGSGKATSPSKSSSPTKSQGQCTKGANRGNAPVKISISPHGYYSPRALKKIYG